MDDETRRHKLLDQLARQGGAMELGKLHMFSKLACGAAHQHFSELMEGLVADGRVTFDQETQTFALQGSGDAGPEGDA